MRGAVFPLAYIFAAVRFWPKADIAQEEVTGKFRNFTEMFCWDLVGPDSIVEPVQICGDLHESEVDCCRFRDRRRASVCAGPKAKYCEGHHSGRAKGCHIDQWRQGQDPNLLRYRQAQ